MRRILQLLLPLLLLASACLQEAPLGPPPGERTLLGERVSTERLMATVTGMTEINTRFMHCYPNTEEALDLLMGILADQGTPAEPDSFTFFRHQLVHTANLEILFPGTLHPEYEVQVGAHWDCISYPESFLNRCFVSPGAVDNATGAAAVVELARLLRGVRLGYSVRLILFAGEEVGLKGSYRTVDNWRTGAYGDSLICLVNVDMVGQDPDLPDASIVCSAESGDLAARALAGAQAAVQTVAVDTLLGSIGNSHGSSDHLPFWYNGLPAIWLHEGPEDAAHEANSSADSLGLVEPEYLADCTRALLGMVLALAYPAH
jgi:hypothetical protein